MTPVAKARPASVPRSAAVRGTERSIPGAAPGSSAHRRLLIVDQVHDRLQASADPGDLHGDVGDVFRTGKVDSVHQTLHGSHRS